MSSFTIVQCSKFYIFVDMYNVFRGIRNDGVFVYGLTRDNHVFYVGITGFLLWRYKQHFAIYPCSQYIMQMREKGEYPGIRIFGIYDNNSEAQAAEHSLIRCLSLMGNKLLNYHQNPHLNKLEYDYVAPTNKIKNMPRKVLLDIYNKALTDYNTFRQWEPRTIWERSQLGNMPTNTTLS